MTTNMQAITTTMIPSRIRWPKAPLSFRVDASCSTARVDTYVIVVKRTRKSDTCDTISDGNAENCQHSDVHIASIEQNAETHWKATYSEDTERWLEFRTDGSNLEQNMCFS